MATTMSQTAEYLTLEETAGLCRVRPGTVSAWVRSGSFPQPIRIGRRLLFEAAEVRAYLKRLRQERGRGEQPSPARRA